MATPLYATIFTRPHARQERIVVNKHHGEEGEYIGRGSPLGNPFSHQDVPGTYKCNTRGIAVSSYRYWLMDRIKERDTTVTDELDRLAHLAMKGPLKLQCFCAPKECHGDIIAATLKDAIEEHLSTASDSSPHM